MPKSERDTDQSQASRWNPDDKSNHRRSTPRRFAKDPLQPCPFTIVREADGLGRDVALAIHDGKREIMRLAHEVIAFRA